MAESLITRRGGGGGGGELVAEITVNAVLSEMYVDTQFSIKQTNLIYNAGSYADIQSGDIGIAYRDGQYIGSMRVYRSNSSSLSVYGAIQTEYTGASWNNYLKTGDVIEVFSFVN